MYFYRFNELILIQCNINFCDLLLFLNSLSQNFSDFDLKNRKWKINSTMPLHSDNGELPSCKKSHTTGTTKYILH